MTDLAKRYTFFSDEAFEAASEKRLPPLYASEMMKVLEIMRSVAAGTSLVLRAVVNADVMESSGEAHPQMSRTDLFILQTLCQTHLDMLEERVTSLMDDINVATSKPGVAL